MVHLTHATKPIQSRTITRQWHLIDAQGKTLGRVASSIARWLQGKHMPQFVPYLDSGDYVVVTNAKRVRLTGRKTEQKTYTHYSGYPSGLRVTSFARLMEKNPSTVIRRAVAGMLPKNKHRQDRLGRLFVFADDQHPYHKQLEKHG